MNKQNKWERRVTDLQNISKLHGDVPFSRHQFILAKVKFPDRSHRIDGNTVSDGEFKHVEGQIPVSRHIPGYHANGEAMKGKCLVPHWEEDGRQVFECKCNFP